MSMRTLGFTIIYMYIFANVASTFEHKQKSSRWEISLEAKGHYGDVEVLCTSIYAK